MKALRTRTVAIMAIASALTAMFAQHAVAEPPAPPPLPSPKLPPLPPLPVVKVPNAPPLPMPGVDGLEYRILTTVPTKAERSHVANLGAPALVDVDGNGAPDITVLFAGPVLRIARVTPAGVEAPLGVPLKELKLRVQIVAGFLGDTGHSAAFGYDTLDSTAPALFAADVAALPTGSISLEVLVAGAGPRLAVLGALLDGSYKTASSQWATLNPLMGRLGFSPVPLSARFEVQRADSQMHVTATTTEPTVANILVEKTTGNSKRSVGARVEPLPTQVSLLVTGADDGPGRIDYTAATPIDRITGTLEDRSPASSTTPIRKLAVDIRDLPSKVTILPTADASGLQSLQYQASAPIPLLEAALERRATATAPLSWQAIVGLTSIPARWDLTRQGATYTFVAGAPIGVLFAGYATGGVPISRSYDADYPAHFTNNKVSAGEVTTVRLLGVSQAEVRATDGFGMMIVQSSQKFRAVITRPNISATMRVDKLPSVIQIDYIPSGKGLHYTASAVISRIDVEATHASGFIADARFLTATLTSVPKHFVLKAAPVESTTAGGSGSAIPVLGEGPKQIPHVDPVAAVQKAANSDPHNPLDPKPSGQCMGAATTTQRGFSFDAGTESLGLLTVTLSNAKGTPLPAEATFAKSGVDGVLAVLGDTRTHVMGRITKLRRADFARTVIDAKCYDESTDFVRVDTVDSRKLKVEIATTAIDSATLEVSKLVPNVTIEHRNVTAPWGGGREVTYGALPGSTTALSAEVVQGGSKLASFTVKNIPDYVHVCMMHGPYCSAGLGETTGDLDLSFTASKPVEAHFWTCFAKAECVSGERSLTVDIPTLQRFSFALLAPTACCWMDGGIFTDGYLFVDTDDKELRATASYKDSTGEALEAASVKLPAGFKAQDRKVTIAIGADWDGIVAEDESGTIDCDPWPSIHLTIDDAPNQQMAGELCDD